MDENIIVRLESDGVVTSTFRKLSPAKKQKLYRAALSCFAGDVFDRVSFDIIAEAAVVAKASLFQYFLNKENLLRFVCEIFIDNHRQFLKDYFGREYSVKARERIISFYVALFDFWQEKEIEFGFYMKMLFENSSGITSDFIGRVSSMQNKYISDIIARGAQVGEIRRDIDPDRISFVLSMVFDGMYRHLPAGARSRKKIYRETLVDGAVGLLFDGIGA
jgi:AcrR family transcriptional regulator